jgi:RNA polymerase sigma factor (sigma-70 family)
MSMLDDERALVLACAANDRRAWNELVQRYSLLVYSSVLRAARAQGIALSEEEVDDLHNAVFVALYEDDCRRLRACEGRCRLTSWIKVVSVNLSIDYIRRKRRMRRTFVADTDSADGPSWLDAAPDGVDAERKLAARREWSWLQRAMGELTPQDRLLLERLFVDEASYEDIAAELHTTVGAVYTRKTRLLDKLRAAVPGEIVRKKGEGRASD